MIYYLPYLIDKIFFYNCHRKICGFVNSLASRILVPNSGLQISKYGSVRNIFRSGHSIRYILTEINSGQAADKTSQNVRCLNAPTWARVYQKAKPSAPIRPRPVTLKNGFPPLPVLPYLKLIFWIRSRIEIKINITNIQIRIESNAHSKNFL